MASVKGGTKYKSRLLEIADRLAHPPTLRVGFLENSSYPNGTKVALVAAVQEYGTFKAGAGRNVTIPPRPFFRSMIAQHSKEWPAELRILLKANDYDVEKTLKLMGEALRGQLMQSILQLVSPPNAPSTIAKKGSDKPLIDSGHMLNSVDYDVK